MPPPPGRFGKLVLTNPTAAPRSELMHISIFQWVPAKTRQKSPFWYFGLPALAMGLGGPVKAADNSGRHQICICLDKSVQTKGSILGLSTEHPVNANPKEGGLGGKGETRLNIISFLTMEYWNQTLQYFLGARGIFHSTLLREQAKTVNWIELQVLALVPVV